VETIRQFPKKCISEAKLDILRLVLELEKKYDPDIPPILFPYNQERLPPVLTPYNCDTDY